MQKIILSVFLTFMACFFAFAIWHDHQPKYEAVSSPEVTAIVRSIYCDTDWVICPNDWRWITNTRLFVQIWTGEIGTRTNIITVPFTRHERNRISDAARWRSEELSRAMIRDGLKQDATKLPPGRPAAGANPIIPDTQEYPLCL